MYYFTYPETNLYLREIAERIGEDPGNLSKELTRLEKDGLFVSNQRGNQKYYSVNRDYYIYDELRSIIFKKSSVQIPESNS